MITSNSNAQIISIRKLLESKFRRTSGLFLAEGLRVVGQALESHAAVEQLIFSPELLISEYGQLLVESAQAQEIPLLEVSASVFSSLARKDKPQGIAAVIQQKWFTLSQLVKDSRGIWVALESVQNPGNLGTILRTCDAVAAKGLILLNDSTDPFDPAAIKASMGSIFTIPLSRANFESFSQWLGANPQLSLVGTSDKAPLDAFATKYPPACVLMMGSEREGLSPDYLKLCNQIVRLPMEGACDSLNLAIAAGIMLYQIYQYQKNFQGQP